MPHKGHNWCRAACPASCAPVVTTALLVASHVWLNRTSPWCGLERGGMMFLTPLLSTAGSLLARLWLKVMNLWGGVFLKDLMIIVFFFL